MTSFKRDDFDMNVYEPDTNTCPNNIYTFTIPIAKNQLYQMKHYFMKLNNELNEDKTKYKNINNHSIHIKLAIMKSII